MWVLMHDPNGYTVGYYTPDGGWYQHITLDTQEEAEMKVAFLNGGVANNLAGIYTVLDSLAKHLEELAVKGQIY